VIDDAAALRCGRIFLFDRNFLSNKKLRAHRPDEHVRMLMWRLPREGTGPAGTGPVLRHTEMTFPV
ncbi:MAG: hypothetical protein ACLR9Z_10145, partial [Alitiscatomonas sp.]